MKSPALRFLLFLAAWVAAACSSDPATCDIEGNGDGTRTITCPGADPIRVVDGDHDASCTIASDGEGGKVIQCSDGTFVHIDENGVVHFPGNGHVEGRAMLFGLQEHAGIRVYAEGTEHETTTDSTGHYVLGPLPAGIHVLVFEAPGRITVREKNVPVINGTYQLDPVLLKFGRWVTANGSVNPAPTGDAVLVTVSNGGLGGWVSLWELETGEEQPLGGIVAASSFSDDGRWVLYQERTALDGPLQLWDRSSAERITIAERSLRGEIAPGGEVVVYETEEAGGLCTLHVFRIAERSSQEIGGCTPNFRFPSGPRVWHFGNDGKQFIYADASDQLVVYDFASGQGHDLGPAPFASSAQILEGGRYAIGVQPRVSGFTSVDLVLLDAETGDRRVIGSDVDQGAIIAAPGGGSVLFLQHVGSGAREFAAWRVAEAELLVLSAGGPTSQWRFSQDGRRVAWIAGESWQAGIAHTVDLEEPENLVRYEIRSAQRVEFDGSGDQLLVFDSANELHRWNPTSGEAALLEASPAFWQWSPDRTKVALTSFSGDLSIFDLASGEVHRERSDAGGNTFAWRPDGAGIVFMRSHPEGADLIRWEPPADPQRIGGGFISGFQIAESGTVIFLECTGTCAEGLQLVLHDPARDAREPIDSQVSFFVLAHGVLTYAVASPLPDDTERNGFYVAQMP